MLGIVQRRALCCEEIPSGIEKPLVGHNKLLFRTAARLSSRAKKAEKRLGGRGRIAAGPTLIKDGFRLEELTRVQERAI